MLESWCARPVAGFYAMQGRFDEARALLAQSRAIQEELARPIDIATLGFWSGPLELLAGNAEAAEGEIRPACEVLESRGEKGWFSTMTMFLAEALYQQERFDEAAAAVQAGKEAATSDDYNAQALWRCMEAKLLARGGQFDEAEALAHEAVAFIGRSDELNNHANVQLDLVEVYRLASRRAMWSWSRGRGPCETS